MYYDIMQSPVGPIIAVKDGKSLRYLGFQHGKHPLQIADNWKQSPKMLKTIFSQIQEYFRGERFAFDLPLATYGTAFQQSVWSALIDIPYGHTVSYRDIAVAIGRPRAYRAVGSANGKNPIPLIIPCHRVVGSNGKLAGYSSGIEIKTELLKIEAANSPYSQR